MNTLRQEAEILCKYIHTFRDRYDRIGMEVWLWLVEKNPVEGMTVGRPKLASEIKCRLPGEMLTIDPWALHCDPNCDPHQNGYINDAVMKKAIDRVAGCGILEVINTRTKGYIPKSIIGRISGPMADELNALRPKEEIDW